jgi:hypothetical protein
VGQPLELVQLEQQQELVLEQLLEPIRTSCKSYQQGLRHKRLGSRNHS